MCSVKIMCLMDSIISSLHILTITLLKHSFLMLITGIMQNTCISTSGREI